MSEELLKLKDDQLYKLNQGINIDQSQFKEFDINENTENIYNNTLSNLNFTLSTDQDIEIESQDKYDKYDLITENDDHNLKQSLEESKFEIEREIKRIFSGTVKIDEILNLEDMIDNHKRNVQNLWNNNKSK